MILLGCSTITVDDLKINLLYNVRADWRSKNGWQGMCRPAWRAISFRDGDSRTSRHVGGDIQLSLLSVENLKYTSDGGAVFQASQDFRVTTLSPPLRRDGRAPSGGWEIY